MKLLRHVKYRLVRSALNLSKHFVPPHNYAVRHVCIDGQHQLVLANEDVGRQIYFLRRYESDDVDFLRRSILPTDFCFDIGANTGYFSVMMGAAAREGIVCAFEPVPLNYHLLNASVLLNGLPVRAYQLAVSDREEETSFSQSVDSAYSSLLPVGRRAEAQKIAVRTITIADFVRREGIPRIDILKIDVEGAEERVLKGGAPIIQNPQTRPRLIMVELFDTNLASFGSSIDQVMSFMKGCNYNPFVSEGKTQLRPYLRDDRNRFCNVFFIPEPMA